ncbi:MAG TPA: CsbD family protein [Pirellulales bacterium]
MLNAQEVRGQWDMLRGKIKQKWGQLTDDDLQIIGGNVDELVGRIHEKTGVAREHIEHFVSDLASGSSQTVERARDYASQAAGRMRDGYEEMSGHVRDGYEEMSGRMREGYERVGRRVRERPAQSMLAVFGAGVVAGVVLTLMLRSD